ncbi:hypothetical protein, variant 2 [Exophiala sideris]|uniref:Uncharacterized protein n=1 Tax=Exophiala sideris TaxID=1016849 RepID=A0A0D1YLD5_9EURO|nr:hypothetical protein, variant 2 [Exophiala sideris]
MFVQQIQSELYRDVLPSRHLDGSLLATPTSHLNVVRQVRPRIAGLPKMCQLWYQPVSARQFLLWRGSFATPLILWLRSAVGQLCRAMLINKKAAAQPRPCKKAGIHDEGF